MDDVTIADLLFLLILNIALSWSKHGEDGTTNTERNHNIQRRNKRKFYWSCSRI